MTDSERREAGSSDALAGERDADDLDIPIDIWDQAVAEVDGERGYTLEFAPDSIEHRLAYRDRAEQIVANLTDEAALSLSRGSVEQEGNDDE